jgi:hypothetical protein
MMTDRNILKDTINHIGDEFPRGKKRILVDPRAGSLDGAKVHQKLSEFTKIYEVY